MSLTSEYHRQYSYVRPINSSRTRCGRWDEPQRRRAGRRRLLLLSTSTVLGVGRRYTTSLPASRHTRRRCVFGATTLLLLYSYCCRWPQHSSTRSAAVRGMHEVLLSVRTGTRHRSSTSSGVFAASMNIHDDCQGRVPYTGGTSWLLYNVFWHPWLYQSCTSTS